MPDRVHSICCSTVADIEQTRSPIIMRLIKSNKEDDCIGKHDESRCKNAKAHYESPCLIILLPPPSLLRGRDWLDGASLPVLFKFCVVRLLLRM